MKNFRASGMNVGINLYELDIQKKWIYQILVILLVILSLQSLKQFQINQ